MPPVGDLLSTEGTFLVLACSSFVLISSHLCLPCDSTLLLLLPSHMTFPPEIYEALSYLIWDLQLTSVFVPLPDASACDVCL